MFHFCAIKVVSFLTGSHVKKQYFQDRDNSYVEVHPINPKQHITQYFRICFLLRLISMYALLNSHGVFSRLENAFFFALSSIMFRFF